MLNLSPLWLSLHLATVTTILLLIIGVPLAWWLSRTQAWFKTPIEVLVALPIILPPTVLGFYLLLLMGPNGSLGNIWHLFTGEYLAFSFAGLVIGSILYSLPFMVQPLQTAFGAISQNTIDSAAMLGASRMDTFFNIILPLSRQGILTGMVLSFTHTLGEFGVVLMIGGNIPNKTQVVSIAIYESVEKLDYYSAHILSAGMLILSSLFLYALFSINLSYKKRKHLVC